MKLTRIFLIILVFILVLNPGLLVAANEGEIITEEAGQVHINYIDNAILQPFLGTDTVNRALIYGDYLPLYMSEPAQFVPYPTSTPPYKNLWHSAQEVINAANNTNDPLHAQALNLRSFADAILAMEEKENIVKNNLAQQDINFALNQQSIYFYEFNGIPPSSIWQYNPIESLQTPYQPNSLMQLDNTFIAPMNQWNSVTYNPSEDYIEELDVLLNPVPDMSFLDEVFKQSGPLGDLASALADVANPYTFLPALFMLGMDIYLQSQKQIGFLYPTVTGYQISPCPESGMITIKNNDQQMIYNISEGESGSITNIPSGDFGTFFVDAVNSFSGGIRPSVSLINDDLLNGGRVQYNNISSDLDYSLNLESHVGVTQNNLELCDTVICKIQGSGPIVMIPFKIGSWFKCDQDQKGDIKSKTTIGVRFKDDDKYYTYDLADCALNNINNSVSANQNGILMWSGVISIYAEEYGKSEIEEIYLALNSSAKKTSGLNKVNCYTSLSFSPYFLKPIISLPDDIETYPGETITFQTELLEALTDATVDISWQIGNTDIVLEGYESTYTFEQPSIYDIQMVVDPQSQPQTPTTQITAAQEFWNTDAGKMVWPFQVNVLPPVDLEVSWSMPPCIPLNSKNYPGQIYYPGRTSIFSFYLTNKGNKDFIFNENNPSSLPITLSFFIDRDDNHTFSPQELVWSNQITALAAQSSVFYNLEKIFSLDRLEGESVDDEFIYDPGFHLCKLQVDILPEEENQVNNSIQASVEFISSPELDAFVPDFAVENARFSVDQYKNFEVSFDLAEKSGDRDIINKWNSYHEDNPYLPNWGPVSYEVELRNINGHSLLYSGEVGKLNYQEVKPIQLESLNLNYIQAGSCSVVLVVNIPGGLTGLPESDWQNNYKFFDWFTLTDDATSPWYTKGGDRGHTGWKNIDLKPPLITDLIIETDGVPVDMVCNSTYFYVLTSSGSIEKYNASGELQYVVPGFDGTPLFSSVMLLIYPDTDNEKLLAFSDDYKLVMIDTQTGNKIWTSNHIFTETTYGSRPSLREYGRTLDFDGRYLIAGSPLVLYQFDLNMNAPILRWEKDKKRYGEAFIIGNNIFAGQYLYSLNGEEGEELEYFKWMDNEAILYLRNLYTDRNKYDYLSQQLTEMENLKNPGSLFSNKILCGNKMLCVDSQGNELWTLPDEIEQEYYSPNSTPQSIPVRIRSNSVINLWNGSEGYAYCINDKSQLLAVDLETGTPVWYREFVCRIADLREKIPPFMLSLLREVHSGIPYSQNILRMEEGFKVNIQKIIPFQNSLLVGTIDNKIYRLSSSQLDHFEVQGYIPSVFYGPSRLKVKVQAFNEQGAEISLEDKITVSGDYIDQNHPRYYYVQEEISLPIGLPDSEKYLVDYPNPPYIVSNLFNFVDVQTLSPRISVPLVIDNVQSRRRISQKDVPTGEEFILSMDDESRVVYKPRNDKNSITFYYSEYGQEDISQVLHEHSYHLIASIRNAQVLLKEYDFIDLYIHLPEGINVANFSVKINKKIDDSWSLDLLNNTLIIHCLNVFLEQNTNNLSVIILKSPE
ncbi:MAG: hypothetical protein WBF28_09180 [Atribacterota bacterium]